MPELPRIPRKPELIKKQRPQRQKTARRVWNVGEVRIAIVPVMQSELQRRTGTYNYDGKPVPKFGTHEVKSVRYYPVLLRRLEAGKFEVVRQDLPPYSDPKMDSELLGRVAKWFGVPVQQRAPQIALEKVSGLKTQ